MITQNYACAYKEVIELLKYFSLQDIEKIPVDLIKVFLANMDKDYEYHVDIDKSFEEQTMLEETEAIFAIIFRDYWATENQRQRIIAKEENDRRKLEEEKSKKYDSNDIFKNTKRKQQEVEEILPIEIKHYTLFEKIINRIKYIFKRNR